MTLVSKFIAKALAISLLAGSNFPGIFTNEATASEEPIHVFMNHARILKFDEDVSSVIVGNSEITDITVSDAKTVVLTAKSFGSTNLVVLDGQGVPVLDRRIVVSVDEENSVRVFRQVERTVLSCSPICEQQNTK